MRTLLILDKAGTNLQYAIVNEDLSRFNGLILNRNTEIEKECINYICKGMENYSIVFTPDISEFAGLNYKPALIVYYTDAMGLYKETSNIEDIPLAEEIKQEDLMGKPIIEFEF